MVRAVLISGTLGAGKTRIAEEIGDVLSRRGSRCGVVDLDWLCQMDPPPTDDRFNDRLAFANLAAIWPNYVAAGIQYFVVARVVENASDRAHYEEALPGVQLKIVRLEASSATCRARLTQRQPEGHSRDWHLGRTDTLAGILKDLALDDFVVQNDERSAEDVANEIISLLNW